MLISIPPKMSVSSFMGYLKGKSALMIFDRHANLKDKFGNFTIAYGSKQLIVRHKFEIFIDETTAI